MAATFAWQLVTPPVGEPLTLLEAKQQARITADDENSLFVAWIKAAREAAETSMSRGLLTQTWKVQLDQFEEVVYLPMASPLQSVTSVKYYDTNGTQQTLSTSYYSVDTASRPGRVVRAPLQAWPSVQSDRLGGVEITYVVGWTTAALVPERIKQGMRLYVSALAYDRDGSVAALEAFNAAEACWNDKVYWIPPTC